MSAVPDPGPWVEDYLSAPRFRTYVTYSDGDRGRALDLYVWNARVAAAVDINDRTRQQVREAMYRCERDAPVGKVIAELSFGFWRYLTINAREKALWVPYLHHVFPPGTDRHEIDACIGRLHGLRNRAAHHEPLVSLDLEARFADLMKVCRLVSPALADHVGGVHAAPPCGEGWGVLRGFKSL